ncbi:MAG: 30S ribosomal protein S9 [Armatimonadetes bacterium]|nr:30S ribosomal protein S9 [Armatimonadota bacterium]
MATIERFYATGKRKDAVARVWITPGTGRVLVNGKTLEEYFERPQLALWILQPLQVAEKLGAVDVKAKVRGGGKTGQAGALRHGIARALVEMDETLRPRLSQYRMLTRDPRVKERKHAGFRSARRGKQFSKR